MRTQSDTTQDQSIVVAPKMPWRIRTVKPLTGYRLLVSFQDGCSGIVDMSALIRSSHAGVFSALEDVNLFNQVFIEYGAVTWPGELDLAPDAMHDEIKRHGEWVLG